MKKVIYNVSLIICFSVSICVSSIHAQEEPNDAILRINTNLVVLDAVVRRKDYLNQIVNDLTRNDFVIYEDKKPQQILSFSQDKVGLSIILLLDISASMNSVVKRLQDEAKSSLKFLRPDDEVAVAIFAGQTVILSEATTDRAQTIKALSAATEKDVRKQAGSGTNISEGIHGAVQNLVQKVSPQKRRVVLAITDNAASSLAQQKRKEGEIADWIYDSDVTVGGIIIDNEEKLTAKSAAATAIFAPLLGATSLFSAGGVNRFAAKSGGEVFKAQEGQVAVKLGEMFERLRSRYVIGYEPSNTNFDGRFRQIKVELSTSGKAKVREKVEIKAKKGYGGVVRKKIS